MNWHTIKLLKHLYCNWHFYFIYAFYCLWTFLRSGYHLIKSTGFRLSYCFQLSCGDLHHFRITSHDMMTSSNENIFRVTGPLCGEFTGHRWVPLTKPVSRSLDVFFDLRLNKPLSKQSWAGDLRSHRAHYDVIVMSIKASTFTGQSTACLKTNNRTDDKEMLKALWDPWLAGSPHKRTVIWNDFLSHDEILTSGLGALWLAPSWPGRSGWCRLLWACLHVMVPSSWSFIPW